ncbi:Putative protein of unknown function [Podospora comata]|uniref:BAH domain-containing protein n=1 Tax=Podospora comata TaxID=48703 RepID=A0ABY6RZG3_PODCO|nr:Putative protein of unknown function [Podospora comata]
MARVKRRTYQGRKAHRRNDVPSETVWRGFRSYKSFFRKFLFSWFSATEARANSQKVNETRFCVGDTISVVNPDTVRWQQDIEDGKAVTDNQPHWVARIVSIRAKDTAHVYALVQWFYFPHDLPNEVQKDGGFGEQELILSNHSR